MSDRNAAIRALIEHRFPDATPVTHRTAEPVATGVEALDAILPGYGLPRGRLTVWMPQGGATAVLRAACNTTVAQGERAVWIDGLCTMAGPFWEEGPVLFRPRNRKHGLRGDEEFATQNGLGTDCGLRTRCCGLRYQRHCASLTNYELGNLLRTNCGLGDKVVRTSDCALFATRSSQGSVPIRNWSAVSSPIRS